MTRALTLSERLTALAAVLVVAACVVAAPAPSGPKPPGGPGGSECTASSYQNLIGQPASVLDGLDLPDNTRILPPGSVVTMDYNATRLNFDLDAAGRIIAIRCG